LHPMSHTIPQPVHVLFLQDQDIYTLIVLSFFFSSSADHPLLHSFPTRRSSDLASRARPRLRRCHGTPLHGEPCIRQPDPPPFPRSEEHTSELQSRGHLVCRLLLEKKKVE